eukprot:8860248-Ditylum_brightwellii.AAC.1
MKGTNFQCPVCGHFARSVFDKLLRQYSLPFVIGDLSGSDANATACLQRELVVSRFPVAVSAMGEHEESKDPGPFSSHICK